MGDKQKLYTIVIIRKDGGDGQTLDLETGETYLFGSNQRCQIRLKPEFVTGIADQHAKIVIESSGKATATNMSGQDNSVKLKSGQSEVFVTAAPVQLQHGDVLTICTRSFRFEDISKRKPDSAPAKSASSSRSEESKRFRDIRNMGIEKDSDAQMKDWGVYGSRRASKRSSDTSGDGSATKKSRAQVTRRRSEPGKLGKWADAARRVLEMEGRPLTVREIADKALEHGFVTECGKTPQNSITSTLHSEVRKPSPMFKKVSAATFALASWDHIKGIDPDKVGRPGHGDGDEEVNESESEEKIPKKSRRSDAKEEKPAPKAEPMQTDATEAPKGDGK
jgi:hypothetical protein